MDPEAEYQKQIAWESRFYDQLVSDGARGFGIRSILLEENSRSPERHRELLRYWK